jgi:carbamoyl-phosphate synthase large subunit
MVHVILVSSASWKIPLLRALQESIICKELGFEICAGDTNPKSLSFNFCESYWVMPKTEDKYLSQIIEGCKKRSIRVIVPTRDGELRFYSQNKQIFIDQGIQILVPHEDAIEVCIDKLLFSDSLESLDISVIPSFLNLDDRAGNSVVVKERFGSGSQKIALNLTPAEASFHAASLKNPIFQPMVVGREFSVDVWIAQDLTAAIASPRTRDLVIDGEAKITTTFSNKEIEDLAIKLTRSIGVTGISVVQGFILPNNQLVFIECNARFGGATTASINSGIPLFDLALLDLLGISTDSLLAGVSRKTIRQVRASFDYCF